MHVPMRRLVVPGLVGTASQVLRQGLAVVLGEDSGRAPLDELVQIGRVSLDGTRGHPQVRAGICGQPEDPPPNRVQSHTIVFCRKSHIAYQQLVVGPPGHPDSGTSNVEFAP